MYKNKARFFLTLALSVATLAVNANTVAIGDLNYELNTQDKTASLVSGSESSLSSMTSVTVPATIESDGDIYTVAGIGSRVFSGLKNLESVSLPSTITTIGSRVFSGSGLRSIEIPEKVTEIATGTFSQCLQLEDIKFSSKLTTIGEEAFFECGFKSLEIPEGVTTICGAAFASCPYLEYLSLPSTLKSIEIGGFGDPFSVLSNLHTLVIKSVAPPKVSSEYWVISNATIPAESCVLFVPAGSEAAYGATNYWGHLKYTAAIGSDAPIIIDTIDGLKYAMCRADMTAALLPKGIQVEMPGVESPPNPNENYAEGSVAIPPTVIYGGDSYKVTSLAKYAFSRCSTVDQVIVPEGVTQIDKYAFEYSSIKSVSLPASLKEIGDRAFASCVKLTKLVIPGTEIIGNDVISGCDNLEELTFEEGTTAIGDIRMQLPSTIKIKRLRFPNTLKKLGRVNVGYVDLEEIILPSSLEEIEYLSLSKDGLTIYSLNPIPPAIVDSPYGRSLLYVPESAVEVYKNSSKWKSLSREILPIVNDLTVSATDGGNVAVNGMLLSSRQTSFDGEDFNIKFFPDANRAVESVTLNGKDISTEVENQQLCLTGLSMRNRLDIVFAERPEATICVKGAESHSTVHTYAEGTEARIALRPEDGWSVHSVLYNDEDVTADLVDNVLTTKPLYGDNQLNVIMEKDCITDVNGITFAKRHIYVRSNGDKAEIVNLDDNEVISVYEASGKRVYQGRDHNIALSRNEVYILKTARETLKFAF